MPDDISHKSLVNPISDFPSLKPDTQIILFIELWINLQWQRHSHRQTFVQTNLSVHGMCHALNSFISKKGVLSEIKGQVAWRQRNDPHSCWADMAIASQAVSTSGIQPRDACVPQSGDSYDLLIHLRQARKWLTSMAALETQCLGLCFYASFA